MSFSNVSIIIPFRGGDTRRERNAEVVRDYLDRSFPCAELIWASDDLCGQHFSRARAINNGAAKSTRDLLLITDADIVYDPQQILDGIHAIREGAGWVVPYSGYRALTEKATIVELSYGSLDLSRLARCQTEMSTNNESVGGLTLISKSNFDRIGGFDPRFIGWGREDWAFRSAANTLIGGLTRIDGNIYHLWHPNAKRQASRDGLFAKATALWQRYVESEGDVQKMSALVGEYSPSEPYTPSVNIDNPTIMCLVTKYLPDLCAGAEWAMHRLLKSLIEYGYSITVYTKDRPSCSEYDGVQLRWENDVDITAQVSVASWIISSHTRLEQAFALKKSTGVRVAGVFCHCLSPVWKDLAAKADLAVVNSNQLRNVLGTGVIAHPVPFVETFSAPIPYPDTFTVMLSNLNENKGADLFYELAQRMPDIQFVGVLGDYGAQVVRHDLPNVTLLEAAPDQRTLHGHASVEIVPSDYESWGLIATEAALAGRPVIASPTPGLIENLGSAGIFVEKSDIRGWELAIRGLQSDDEFTVQARRGMRRAASLIDIYKDQAEHICRLFSTKQASTRPGTEFNILIPYEPGCPVRDQFIGWVQEYYASHLPQASIILAGDDHVAGQPLNRSRMRNNCAKRCTSDGVLVFLDADCLVRPEEVLEAVRLVGDGAPLVMWQSVDYLSQTATARITRKPPGRPYVVREGDVEKTIKECMGFNFVLTRETFDKVHGFDEKFIGYAYEDIAFAEAIEVLVGKRVRMQHSAYHLWHPEDPHRKVERVDGTLRANRTRLNQYRTLKHDPHLLDELLKGANIPDKLRTFKCAKRPNLRVKSYGVQFIDGFFSTSDERTIKMLKRCYDVEEVTGG